MKNKLLFSFLALTSFVRGMESDDDEYSLKKRPIDAQKEIDKNFQNLSEQKRGVWGYNGENDKDKNYYPLSIDDYVLVVDILEKGISAGRKEFVFLDVCGGFGIWGRSLMKFLNSRANLPKDLKVHIITVTGEGYQDETIEEGICTLYHRGKFKVEDFPNALKDAKLEQFSGKIDLAVSRYTWIHLVDPLKTMEDVLNALRSEGWFFIDGFPFYFKGHEIPNYYAEGYKIKNTFDFKDVTKRFIKKANRFFGLAGVMDLKPPRQRDDSVGIGLYPICLQKRAEVVRFPLAYDSLLKPHNGQWAPLTLSYKGMSSLDYSDPKDRFFGDENSINWIKGLKEKKLEDFSFSKKSNNVLDERDDKRRAEIKNYIGQLNNLEKLGPLSFIEYSEVFKALQNTQIEALQLLQKGLDKK